MNREREGSREESGSRVSVVGMFLGGGYLAVAAAVKAIGCRIVANVDMSRVDPAGIETGWQRVGIIGLRTNCGD